MNPHAALSEGEGSKCILTINETSLQLTKSQSPSPSEKDLEAVLNYVNIGFDLLKGVKVRLLLFLSSLPLASANG